MTVTDSRVSAADLLALAAPAAPAAHPLRVAGFFPGLGSRAAYQNLDSALLASGIPQVADVYREAARALGTRPERLLAAPADLPRDELERQGYIGAVVLVHSLAVDAYLRHRAADRGVELEFLAYTGESFGILAAAVAAGSLSVFDGVRIAQAFTPLVLIAATAPRTDREFARDLARYVPESARPAPLIAEPCHVIGLMAADRDALAATLAAIEATYRTDQVELHKTYSPTQANVYVSAAVKADFDRFLADIPAVAAEELKAPTVFLAHSARMAPARQALDRFLTLNGIAFAPPRIPVASNHDQSLLTTAAEVRQGILAMTDQVMASRDTCDTIERLGADFVVELGLGEKSVKLVKDNHVAAPVTAYTGSAEDTDRLLRAGDLLTRFSARCEELHAPDSPLSEAHYRVLCELLSFARENEFCDDLVSQILTRAVDAEILQARRPGSSTLRRFLEIFQHSRNYRDHIDAAGGELITKARLKRRVTAEDDGPIGEAFVELRVRTRAGLAQTRTIKERPAEVLVFHFDGRDGLDDLDDLGARDDLDAPGGAGQPVVRQYELFDSLLRHRPALFSQTDHYLAGGDVIGWLAALAVARALPLADVLALHAVDPHAVDVDRILADLAAADIPLLSPAGVPVWSKRDLQDATRAVLRTQALGDGPRRIHLNGACRIISLGAHLRAEDVDAPHRVEVVHVAAPAEARRKRLNAGLDAAEFACLLALTEENGRVLRVAKSRRLLSSSVYAYVESDETIVSFGKGGSESMTIFVRKEGEQRVTVRKILSEALTTARWNPDGAGVMLPPFAKARKQAEYLQALPHPVNGYFPEVYTLLERELPVAPEQRAEGRAVNREVIYEMSYVEGEEVSRFVERYTPPPAVVARLYEQIIRVLNDEVHTVGRVPAPGETLEFSYFRKIEERLELCRRTAPKTFGAHLLDTERIVINGVSYLNSAALLRRLREAPRFLEILEPAFHCLVMGDTNTENIKILDTRPLLRAQRLIESAAPQAEIDAALEAVTAETLGIKFLDPRSIGFKSDGGNTRDDAMYDNKPWHNSIGHYDEIHFEQFNLRVEAAEGATPRVDVTFIEGNPYQWAYRVRDVVERGNTVDTAAPRGMEDYFRPVMTAALGLDDPESTYLRDDPYWLIRFVFMMGQHFTAMPPFHFQKELDDTLTDTYQTQRRPVAIYCEGIKWLNWALQMLEGTRTEFLGFPVEGASA